MNYAALFLHRVFLPSERWRRAVNLLRPSCLPRLPTSPSLLPLRASHLPAANAKSSAEEEEETNTRTRVVQVRTQLRHRRLLPKPYYRSLHCSGIGCKVLPFLLSWLGEGQLLLTAPVQKRNAIQNEFQYKITLNYSDAW